VPKYLQKFNEEKKEQERQRQIESEAKKCPPGTKRMGSAERIELLTELKATKK
jgi:hypothetical protein